MEPYFKMDYNEEKVDGKPTYNESIHQKKQKTILGMIFESPKQLKHIVRKYDVANDYQLRYKKMIVVDFWLNVVMGNASIDNGLYG